MKQLTQDQRETVEANLGLAYNIARQYGRWHRLQFSDLELARSAALEGLCRAAMGYDEDRGEPWVSYAGRVCRNAVLREMRLAGLIRLPAWLSCRARADHPLRQQASRAREVSSGPVAAEHLTFLEAQADDPDRNLDLAWLREAIPRLPGRRRAVVEMRQQGLYYRDIGAHLGISYETVRLEEIAAVNQLCRMAGPM